MTSPTVAPASDAGALLAVERGPLDRLQHTLHRYPVISPALVLLAACVVFTLLGEGRFQRPETIGIMLQQTAVLATLAIGQTLIILTAGIDLSVGTAMLLTHLIVAKVASEQGVPGILALLLGTFYMYGAIGLVYSKAQTISKEAIGEDSLLLWTGKGISIGSMRITVGVLVAIVLYLLFAYVLANTAWGYHVYATGDDREAARLAGIRVDRVILSVYVVAGLVYAIGGWVQLGRSLSASSNAAADINLETITAVVIGGTSLFGGRGRLAGTLIGALIVTVFRIGLNLADVDVYYQNFAIGSLILVAVGLDRWIRKVAR